MDKLNKLFEVFNRKKFLTKKAGINPEGGISHRWPDLKDEEKIAIADGLETHADECKDVAVELKNQVSCNNQ